MGRSFFCRCNWFSLILHSSTRIEPETAKQALERGRPHHSLRPSISRNRAAGGRRRRGIPEPSSATSLPSRTCSTRYIIQESPSDPRTCFLPFSLLDLERSGEGLVSSLIRCRQVPRSASARIYGSQSRRPKIGLRFGWTQVIEKRVGWGKIGILAVAISSRNPLN
jgi:hypothetical protein